jgi:hypothetical protein
MTAGVEGEPVGGAAPALDGVDAAARRADLPEIIGSAPATAQETAQGPEASITVEQAYRAKLRAAAASAPADASVGRGATGGRAAISPASGSPAAPPAAGPADLDRAPPRPVGPRPVRTGRPAGARPAAPAVPPNLRARPRIEPEQGILGLSRHSRSRLGSRLFNLFFVCVFALILVQMVVALLAP